MAFAYLLAYGLVVFVKMWFISRKINYRLRNSLRVILKSYKVALFYLPTFVLCMCIMPNTILWNIVKALIFGMMTIIVFLISPVCVGQEYKDNLYKTVVSFITSKISFLQVNKKELIYYASNNFSRRHGKAAWGIYPKQHKMHA